MDRVPERIDKGKLLKAKPENVLRLAKYLKVDCQGMQHDYVLLLVQWRLNDLP